MAFLFLTALGIRQMIVNAIPRELYSAVAAGVGLFIALIGLRSCGHHRAQRGDDRGAGQSARSGDALALFGLLVTAALLCAACTAPRF